MNAATAEAERFISMYRQQVYQTIDLVSPVPSANYTITPVDNEQMFMGSRVNRINIGTLLRHLIIAESHWFSHLAQIQPGDTIPIPQNASEVAGIADGRPLTDKLLEVCGAGIDTVASLSAGQLTTEFVFVGRRFSVMGFLWSLFAHHAYHKGQIDQLMRELGQLPMEYMEYREKQAVIG
ncbi:MAG: DinB family protein [Bacteroidetes bacterium]|nr:DinB family protein [Fibrella sp.]